MPVEAEQHTAGDEMACHSKVGKHSWTPEEDEKLTAAVRKYGACRWSMISMHVASGRVGKQCRERWNNHLCPEVKKSEWSDAEDLAILQGVADQGTRWCEIVQTAALAGRTDNAIKNRFYALQRRSKAAHAVAARAAAASARQASPLGKRQLSSGAAATAADEKESEASLRDKVMSIATAIACSTDEAERDRLIGALATTLHPRGALPESAPERTAPAKAKGHGGFNRRPSPLSSARSAAAEDSDAASGLLTAYLGVDGRCCPASPTPSFDSSGSPSGDDAPSSFRSDSSDAEDDADLFAYALGEFGEASVGADEHDVCAMADISWAESTISTISTPTLAAAPPGGGAAAAAATAAAPTNAAAAKCLAYGGLAASVAAAAIREGWHAAATGTEEPSAVALTAVAPPSAPAADALGSAAASPVGLPSAVALALGGRYKHRAMLAPLEIPDAGGDTSSFSPIASLLSARTCSGLLSAVSSKREDHTPASAKRQRTPCGWTEAATPPPPTHGSVGATATGTEESGATAPTFAFGLAASPAAASPAAALAAAADGAPSWWQSTPPESPQESVGLLGEASAAAAGLLATMAPSPVSQLQLSYFTDLFVKDGTAAVATAAAIAPLFIAATERTPPSSRRRGRSASLMPTREEPPTPLRKAATSPLVSSPLVPRAAEPWRATCHALQATMVG